MPLAPVARTRCLAVTCRTSAFLRTVTVTGVYSFRPQTLLVQEVDKIQHQMLETPQSLIWNLVESLGPGNRNLGDIFDDGTKP